MRNRFLRDAASGDLVDDVFVITNKQLAAASTGKHYVKAFVSDSSAQMVARMWNTTREIFNWIPDSGFVKIRGRVENYQSNLQFIIESVGPAIAGTFDPADLIPHTPKDIGAMCADLRKALGAIRNRHLSALIQTYLDDKAMMDNFCKAPAAMSFHHAYVGGLLEHTLNALQVADAVCPFYPGLNRDLVIAGIFLHDIAKTWELCYDCSFGYTDAGQLVGHIVKSAMWVEHKAREAAAKIGEPIPGQLVDVLQHIILSHHGTHEFGSPRLPSTPEAIAVHMIENMDAKLMMSLTATRGDKAGGDGTWTEYQKAFGGKLYRPDVAPATDGGSDAPLPPDGDGAAFPRLADTQVRPPSTPPAAATRPGGQNAPAPVAP
ncbi:MAG TPA: HD domain-containing protein, partial [Tepidisphaeraceae bacterium]|nr:HD domain-containing protein [Tepidisphaeraceae bacterium]